ncbi:hypothetical protein [Bradyrhizobium sp. URHC0002]|jgi:hypothetical protein
MASQSDEAKPSADVQDEKAVIALAEMLAKEMGRKIIISFANGTEVKIQLSSHLQTPAD